MTKEETKKAIEVMQAYCEGKTIEYWDGDGWNEIKDPVWAWADGCDDFNYRIKPEPHYRPFKSAEEVMEAIEEHGDWVKVLINDWRLKIIGYSNERVDIGAEHNIPISQAHIAFQFLDGTPFGKLVEE